MIRISSALCFSVLLATASAQANEKKKTEPQPKTIVDVVGNILMAPVKLVEDILKPAQVKPDKK